MIARAYVAGRFSSWRLVRTVQEVLRARGYAITHDWTLHASGEEPLDGKGSSFYAAKQAAARACEVGAKDADLFVLACEGDMQGAIGCYIEFGVALEHRRAIHVIAPPRGSVFWCLPGVTVYDDLAAWSA